MIKKDFEITVAVIGDGVSTTATLDLLSDPYNGASFVNWFSTDRHATEPSGVLAADGNSYSLSGTVVTVTFATAPPSGTQSTYSFFLLF